MLTSLRLNNVRSWKSASIPLSPLTVIVGPNASGKTTILEALRFMARYTALAHGWDATRPETSDRFVRSTSREMELETFGDLNLVLAIDAAADSVVLQGRQPSPFSWTGGRLISAAEGRGLSLLEEFSRLRLLRFESPRLAAASYSDEQIPHVNEDGGDLSTVLAYLKQEAPQVFAKIEDHLRRIVPGLEAIRAPRAKVPREENRTVIIDGTATTLRETRSYTGNELVFDMSGAKGVPAGQAGEGTLLALGLLTALGGIDRPGLALLDDIDMRLHPKAQGELVKIIRSLMAEGVTSQFIGTTHSPFFLQHLRPEEIVVVDNTADGSIARRLDTHPDFDKWKDTMGLGEFWSWAGESWVQRK